MEENYIDYLKRLNEYKDYTIKVVDEKPVPAKIYSGDLLFLASVFEYFDGYGEVQINGNTVRIIIDWYDEFLLRHHIDSTFDIDICQDYYNNVSKFIKEVL